MFWIISSRNSFSKQQVISIFSAGFGQKYHCGQLKQLHGRKAWLVSRLAQGWMVVACRVESFDVFVLQVPFKSSNPCSQYFVSPLRCGFFINWVESCTASLVRWFDMAVEMVGVLIPGV